MILTTKKCISWYPFQCCHLYRLLTGKHDTSYGVSLSVYFRQWDIIQYQYIELKLIEIRQETSLSIYIYDCLDEFKRNRTVIKLLITALSVEQPLILPGSHNNTIWIKEKYTIIKEGLATPDIPLCLLLSAFGNNLIIFLVKKRNPFLSKSCHYDIQSRWKNEKKPTIVDKLFSNSPTTIRLAPH